MPRPGCTWATRNDWLNFYKIGKVDGSVVTYGDDRTWSGDVLENEVWVRANALKAFILANGGALANRILIAGAGLGFLIETMKLVGFTNTFGIDASPWCQQQKATVNSGVVLVNADFNSAVNSLKNAFNAATGGRDFNWIISESVLESYENGEITAITNNIPQLLANGMPNSRIIHIVYTPPFNSVPGVFNEKTMAQWKAMAPTHTWMNAAGYGVA
jgi:hypothetical protein